MQTWDSDRITELEKVLEPLDKEARDYVILQVQETFRLPPMMRMTVGGEEEDSTFAKMWSRIGSTVEIDYAKADQMMATGQVAYPMALKKAPIISIVRSPSGFTVESADKRLAELAYENLKYILPRCIDEVLTFLEYGAFYGEVLWEPGYPQDYGLTKSPLPYWMISAVNGCHPTTIDKIIRNEKTKRFEGFYQRKENSVETVKVGLERALIISNNGLFGDLAGDSVLQPVYVWWYWYELIWRAFLRFLQRAGVGVVVVKFPSHGRIVVNDRGIDSASWAIQMASGLHRTNYAAIPSDADPDTGKELWAVEYLKLGENEGKQFIEALELLASNIKNYLLTGDPKSRDSGEFEVMLDTERILGHIGQHFTDYVLPKFLFWNGSSTRKASLEFQGANSRVLPLLFKLMAVAGNTVGDALRNVAWRELFQKGGVPVLTEDEVEELRQKEIEESQEKARAFRQQQEEKAKMQPGGEGRWARQRDEEGKPEPLEMIAEALDVPLIALSAEQVYELEQLGIRADDAPVVLFNPYHDVVGKFTEKAHAKYPMPEDKFHEHGNVADRASFRVRDAASVGFERSGLKPVDVHVYKSGKEYSNTLCGETSRAWSSCRRSAGNSYAAYTDGAIHVSPRGARIAEADRRFAEYTLTHEAYHGRERSDGSNGPDLSYEKTSTFRRDETYHRAHARRIVEEGSTDLLARKASGVNERYWGKSKILASPAYQGYMGAIAILVGQATNWDLERSWALIEQIQHHINDEEFIYNLLSQVIGTPKDGWNGHLYYLTMLKLQYAAKWDSYRAMGWLFGKKVRP